MNLTPYVASLRIYEPLESFDSETRSLWIQISSNEQTKKRESEVAIKNLILSNRGSYFQEYAHVIDHDGKRFVSPWSIRNRTWVAMRDFMESTPSSILHFFISPELESELSSETLADSKVPHVISERWMIPPRWFALFRSHERVISVDGPETSCVFRTEITKARERCRETHKIVKDAFGVGSVEFEILELLNWLNFFDENSLVELDFGGLSALLATTLRSTGGEGLCDDTSVEDVLESITGLSQGNGDMASKAYERLLDRWRRIASFEQAQ